MELIKNIEVYIYEKVKIKVDVEVYSRGGTLSPELYIIIYKGKRYPPIAQRLYGIRWTLNFLFKRVYSDKIADLIPDMNPLFKMIPKCNDRGSLYHQPVVLGLEHGVVFDAPTRK